MGLFKWSFGVGDNVRAKDGKVYKVEAFAGEGYVVVRQRPACSSARCLFGSGLEKVDSDDKAPKSGLEIKW